MILYNRQLNQQPVKDQNPLPRMDEFFTDLPDAHYLISLHLSKRYHQIPVRVEDISKTAFITHKGLFMFTNMPLRLLIAPSTFQRFLDRIFREHIEKDVDVTTC